MKTILLAALVIAAIGAFSLAFTVPMSVYAGEVNPAHDADNGNGNEGSHGQCKQEARNDNACDAKK